MASKSLPSRSQSLERQLGSIKGGQQGPLGTPVKIPPKSKHLVDQVNNSIANTPGIVTRDK